MQQIIENSQILLKPNEENFFQNPVIDKIIKIHFFIEFNFVP